MDTLSAGHLSYDKMGSGKLIYRHQVVLELQTFQCDITFPQQDIVIQLVRFHETTAVVGCELVAVTRIQVLQLLIVFGNLSSYLLSPITVAFTGENFRKSW